jgi:hypothetical protein
VSKASLQLRNGIDGLEAPRAPANQQGYGPRRIVWEIVVGSDSRSEVGA